VLIAAQIRPNRPICRDSKGHVGADLARSAAGRPLTASTAISDAPIRTFSQIEKADVAVSSIRRSSVVIDIVGSLKPKGWLIVIPMRRRTE